MIYWGGVSECGQGMRGLRWIALGSRGARVLRVLFCGLVKGAGIGAVRCSGSVGACLLRGFAGAGMVG